MALFEPGDSVWVPHKECVWAPGSVVHAADGTVVSVQVRDAVVEHAHNELLLREADALASVVDLTMLAHLHEAAILQTLVSGMLPPARLASPFPRRKTASKTRTFIPPQAQSSSP
jgi:hypothetical protein